MNDPAQRVISPRVAALLPPPSRLGYKALLIEIGAVLLLTNLSTIVFHLLVPGDEYSLGVEIANIPHYLGASAVLALLLWHDGIRWPDLGLAPTRLGRLVLATLALAIVAIVLKHAVHGLFAALDLHEPLPWAYHWHPTNAQASFAALMLTPALYEEVVYRVYLWTRLTQLTRRPAESIVLVSLLFAIGHGYTWPDTIDVFLFGALFGAYFVVFRRLVPIVIAHWLVNIEITFL